MPPPPGTAKAGTPTTQSKPGAPKPPPEKTSSAKGDDPAAKAAFDRGEVALAEGRLEDAAAAYREALASSAEHVGAINGLGSVMYRLGQREEAVEYFRRALELDPTFKLAHFNLGYAARKTGDFITAARAYERYTQLEPGDPDGYYGLAESHRQLEQHPKALAAYEAYVLKEKRPSEKRWVERSREQIALLKQKLGLVDPPDAGTSLAAMSDGGVVLTPLSLSTLSGDGGVALAASTDGGLAITPVTVTSLGAGADGGVPMTPVVLQQAPAAIGVANERGHLDRGDQLVRERRPGEAIASYEAVLVANPANLEALFKAGTAYAMAGQLPQAVERWRRVVQLTPDPQVRTSAEQNILRAERKLQASNPALAAPPPSGGLRILSGGTTVASATAPPSSSFTEPQRRARAAYERGVQQIRARDYAAAHQSFTEALGLEPRMAAALTARGSANIGLRRYAEAAADYQASLSLDGRFASPLYGLAEALRAQGRLTDARAYYERYAASAAPDARAELQAEARLKAGAIR